MSGAPALPSGHLTFLFTDLEDSTRLWEMHRDDMARALAHHDAVMQRAIESQGGVLVKHTGDGVYAVFPDAAGAAAACVDAQRALQPARFGPVALRSRMAIYSGVAAQSGRDYRGPVLNRAARLMAAGHGGQVLVSQSARIGLDGRLPDGVRLRDLGDRRLRDVPDTERVFELVIDGLATSFPPLRTVDLRPVNLPAATTTFVGRKTEIDAIKECFRDGARLVTLSGVGGTGKSRLAVEVARQLVDTYTDGVVFVPLAGLLAPELVLPAIAGAFEVREAGGGHLADELCQSLRGKHLLLVLDNFEQVVAAAPIVSVLLEAAPRLQVLVTSREILRVSGERHYPVGTLALPDVRRLPAPGTLAQVESVALFMARAQAASPGLQLTPDNAPVVAQICRRLDGLPLAIELAAARARVLPLERMRREVEDRLRFLVGGPRNEPERRRTLRATIDWSYEFLNADEQRLFRRLAIFVDGATLEAIEQVCGAGMDVLATLESLLAKSMIRRTGTDEAPRFAMLETIRDYARERLAATADEDGMAVGHTAYFTRLAEEASLRMIGPQQAHWLDRLEAEDENLRAVLAREAATTGAASGLRLCKALHRLWSVRGRLSEGRQWCARMLAASEAAPNGNERIATAHTLAVLAELQNDYDVARPLLEQCAAQWRAMGELRSAARALNNLGNICQDLGDVASARRTYEESLQIKRDVGDRPGTAIGLANLANVALTEGDVARARSLLEESVAMGRELGSREGLAISLVNLAIVMCDWGEPRDARRACEESIAILREIKDTGTLCAALVTLGDIAMAEDAPAAAFAAYAESIAIAAEIGDRRVVAAALEAFGVLAVAIRRPGAAARAFGAATRIREEIRVVLLPRERRRVEAALARAHELMPSGFDEAWEAGRRAPLDQAIDDALQGGAP